jgi:hypothetical protein
MKLPPWSYTFLSCYQICPSQCFHRYVAKDVPFVETPAMRWGNEVHNGMDKRISAGVPLQGDVAKYERWAAPFTGLPVETELRMGVRENGTVCGFYDDDCWGHMKLDLVVTPGDGTARLFDWKTGKVREDPFELRLQALFVQARNPELRAIHGWYVWLGAGPHGKLGQQHDLSDVERTWAEVVSMTHAIQNYAAINHWPEKPSPLCGWCPVKQCQHNKS